MGSLSIDEVDLKILNIFYNQTHKNDTTSWKIAKSLFPDSDRHEISDKSKFIEYRLNKLNHFGLVKRNSEGCSLNSKKIEFKKHKFPSGVKKSVSLKIENKWTIWEL